MAVAAVMVRRAGHWGGGIVDEGRWGKGAEARRALFNAVALDILIWTQPISYIAWLFLQRRLQAEEGKTLAYQRAVLENLAHSKPTYSLPFHPLSI
jgi:hypothetical protein